jgi:hypothetical protein
VVYTVLFTPHSVACAGWVLCVDPVMFFKATVSSGNFMAQLGLEPAAHTSEALAERYLNGSQLILGNLSFRPSTSSSLIVRSQIICPGGEL